MKAGGLCPPAKNTQGDAVPPLSTNEGRIPMNGPAFATQTVPAPVQQRMMPAPPRPAPPQRPAMAKPEGEGQALRFLTYVRLHWLTILFAGALLGAPTQSVRPCVQRIDA